MRQETKGEWVFKPWEPNQLPISLLVDNVRKDLDGEYKREKDKSFETEEHGTVSHDKIRRICVDKFGAESKRTNSIRYLEFNQEKLNKAIAACVFTEKVTILQKNVSESGSVVSDAEEAFLTRVDEHVTEPNHEGSDEENKENTPVKNGQNASPTIPQDSEIDIQKEERGELTTG
jgi:hypothetical protein